MTLVTSSRPHSPRRGGRQGQEMRNLLDTADGVLPVPGDVTVRIVSTRHNVLTRIRYAASSMLLSETDAVTSY